MRLVHRQFELSPYAEGSSHLIPKESTAHFRQHEGSENREAIGEFDGGEVASLASRIFRYFP